MFYFCQNICSINQKEPRFSLEDFCQAFLHSNIYVDRALPSLTPMTSPHAKAKQRSKIERVLWVSCLFACLLFCFVVKFIQSLWQYLAQYCNITIIRHYTNECTWLCPEKPSLQTGVCRTLTHDHISVLSRTLCNGVTSLPQKKSPLTLLHL